MRIMRRQRFLTPVMLVAVAVCTTAAAVEPNGEYGSLPADVPAFSDSESPPKFRPRFLSAAPAARIDMAALHRFEKLNDEFKRYMDARYTEYDGDLQRTSAEKAMNALKSRLKSDGYQVYSGKGPGGEPLRFGTVCAVNDKKQLSGCISSKHAIAPGATKATVMEADQCPVESP